jgi:hypothetical protein
VLSVLKREKCKTNRRWKKKARDGMERRPRGEIGGRRERRMNENRRERKLQKKKKRKRKRS